MKCKQCDGVGKVTIGGVLMKCGPCQGLGVDRMNYVEELRRSARGLREEGNLAAAFVADGIVNYVESLERKLYAIKLVASTQAEDQGLWFGAMTAPEQHLQQALRRLHVEIELRL